LLWMNQACNSHNFYEFNLPLSALDRSLIRQRVRNKYVAILKQKRGFKVKCCNKVNVKIYIFSNDHIDPCNCVLTIKSRMIFTF
jgi:hypothetical protein